MSMLKGYRRVLFLCCSASAIAGVFGAAATGAFAGQNANLGLTDDATTLSEVAGVSDMARTATVDELMRLADLQRRQIILQQKALGHTTGHDSAQVGMDFLLPRNENALRQMIAAQQQMIETQGYELQQHQSDTPVATPSVVESTEAVALNMPQISDPLEVLDETLILPQNLTGQDDAARAQFDLALAESRGEYAPTATEPAVEISNRQVPAWNSQGLIAESGMAVYEAPTFEPTLWLAAEAPRPAAVQPVAYEVAASDVTVTMTPAETVEPAPRHVEVSHVAPAAEAVVTRADAAEREERVTQVAQAYYGSTTVPDAELDEIRAGFVTSNGLIVNIGIVFETLINGELVVQNVLDLNDPTANDLLGPGGIASTITGAEGGTTHIVNMVGGGAGIATSITNSTNDITLEHITTVTIDIPNHSQVFNQVGGGLSFDQGITLPQPMIDMVTDVIQQ